MLLHFTAETTRELSDCLPLAERSGTRRQVGLRLACLYADISDISITHSAT